MGVMTERADEFPRREGGMMQSRFPKKVGNDIVPLDPDPEDQRAEVSDGERYAEGWDRVVNRPGAHDSLICYCGEEVACYHQGCLALVGRLVRTGDQEEAFDG